MFDPAVSEMLAGPPITMWSSGPRGSCPGHAWTGVALLRGLRGWLTRVKSALGLAVYAQPLSFRLSEVVLVNVLAVSAQLTAP
jgi:hypothetical protein